MLSSLSTPRGIAVIGASANKKKLGHAILKNIVSGGYLGAICPVNPKAQGEPILGLRSFQDVSELPPGLCDLAVVATPAATVPGVIAACGKKNVKTAVIISAGFSEVGAAGKELEVLLMLCSILITPAGLTQS